MRRVVVSGLGVVAPNGIGRKEFWSACLNGTSGIKPIRSFDATEEAEKLEGAAWRAAEANEAHR